VDCTIAARLRRRGDAKLVRRQSCIKPNPAPAMASLKINSRCPSADRLNDRALIVFPLPLNGMTVALRSALPAYRRGNNSRTTD
jgi:hypothetical protein